MLTNKIIILVIMIVGFSGFTWFSKTSKIGYESFYEIKCKADLDAKIFNFSFVFVNSFLTITDYKIKIVDTKEGKKKYMLTLRGRHVKDINSVNIKDGIKVKDGRHEITLSLSDFDFNKDDFVYFDGKGEYPIDYDKK